MSLNNSWTFGRLRRKVGRCGMGIVYEAEQMSLRHRVALKILPLAAALDPRQHQRFLLEAWAAACLDHTCLTYRHGGRDYRLTDVHGRVVEGVLE